MALAISMQIYSKPFTRFTSLKMWHRTLRHMTEHQPQGSIMNRYLLEHLEIVFHGAF